MRLIACDIDDTLVPRGGALSERSVQAIKAWTKAGNLFCPVTGRVYSDVPALLGARPWVYETGVYVSGALVMVRGQLNELRLITPAQLDRLAKAVDMGPLANVLVYGSFQGGVAALTRRPGRCQGIHTSQQGRVHRVVSSGDEVRALKANIQFGCSEKEMLEAIGHLRKELPDLDFARPGASVMEVDVSPAGCDKASGLQRLCEAVGVDRVDTIGFGDSAGDLPLLEACGTSYAVGNGTHEARAAADAVIGRCDEDAVAEVIEGMLAGA